MLRVVLSTHSIRCTPRPSSHRPSPPQCCMANHRFSLDDDTPAIYDVATAAEGPAGALPLTDSLLRDSPSGDLFGLSQNAGMGWPADRTNDHPFLILSTQGGVRLPDGSPLALGYHTGHWEIGLLVQAAATRLRDLGTIPFVASAPTRATDARRAPPGCSTVCPPAMMRRSGCEG